MICDTFVLPEQVKNALKLRESLVNYYKLVTGLGNLLKAGELPEAQKALAKRFLNAHLLACEAQLRLIRELRNGHKPTDQHQKKVVVAIYAAILCCCEYKLHLALGSEITADRIENLLDFLRFQDPALARMFPGKKSEKEQDAESVTPAPAYRPKWFRRKSDTRTRKFRKKVVRSQN